MTASEQTILIRIPSDYAHEFELFWKDLRISDGLPPEYDLYRAVKTKNFDGAAITEWIIPLVNAITPVVTAVLGYLIAKRGEIEIKRGENSIKAKNLKPSQLKEFIKVMDQDKV